MYFICLRVNYFEDTKKYSKWENQNIIERKPESLNLTILIFFCMANSIEILWKHFLLDQGKQIK